jgi:hypothetical protein
MKKAVYRAYYYLLELPTALGIEGIVSRFAEHTASTHTQLEDELEDEVIDFGIVDERTRTVPFVDESKFPIFLLAIIEKILLL